MLQKVDIYLLLKYLVVYPFCYALGMLLATVISAFLMGWELFEAKIYFLVLVIGMWSVSYIIHFDLLISSLKKTKLG